MSTATTPLISFQKLGMEFQQQRVLHDINLDITRGQTVVVIGESGCGKTVLLKLMIALLRPTSGAVTFDGKILADLGTQLTVQRRVCGETYRPALHKTESIVPERVDLYWLPTTRCNNQIVNFRIHPRQLYPWRPGM